ncbi:MAG: 1-acyl-sn-glycerol-3-phosphate acyltransferase [Deltaproteobacteria bacterium]|nr:1-acyl-sn-glycerol-3-phosphate acyltransferase [Deltaproteobacteria bacterium]MBW1951937.1 1-acyl-sn-glycerol-3-phosphate acyltransferase [Deltaproteobacteria bacterium]MBW1986316.1 1-acyl-sn-glycerol-3-phosphate acyltransferase [Deltaproteobacteria bacterium]MBW2134357.1 1-acyl-sn-glycerol-3-phosphate acyltransferase [Deltaproteobacteria bacterium]
MLKSLWFNFWLVFLTIFGGIAVILLALHDRQGNRVHEIGRWWARTLLKIAGVAVSIQGLEHLAPDRSYIFAANHQSQFDIFVLQAYLPGQFRWLAKVELFSVPIFGKALRLMGSLPIDRSNRQTAIKSLDQAAAKVQGGTSIIIFPEGTRGATGQLLPFKKGGFVLAIKSGQPIVPVSISGTQFIQPRGVLRIHPGPVKVVLGPPLETTAYTLNRKQELMAELRAAIERNLDPNYPYCRASETRVT